MGSDGDIVTEMGGLFHVRIAPTGKTWSPTVDRRVVGTTRVQVDVAVRRGRRPSGKVRWRQTVKTPEDEYSELIILDSLLAATDLSKYSETGPHCF